MSIWYDVTKCENFEELMATDREQSISTGIMYSMMVVGGPEITAKNWEKIFTRIHQYELACGFGMFNDSKGNHYFVTPEMIERRIGMHTNCPEVDLRWFKKILFDRTQEEANRVLRKYKETA